MATKIRNVGFSNIVLPPPWHATLKPGKSIVTGLAIADCRTILNLSGSGNSIIRLTTVGDAATAGVDVDHIMGSKKLTNVTDPTGAQDAATKAYVDGGGDVDAGEIDYTPTVTGDWPGTDPATVKAALDRLAARTDFDVYVFEKTAADAAAGDATAEIVIGAIRRAGTILSATYYPSAALTANDTNYATLLVDQRDGAGGAPANVATANTNTAGTGSWTAFVGETLGTITNAAVVAGALLTFEITKASAGVVVPTGILVVVVEPAAGA